MRNFGLLLVATTLACGSPEGSMLDTDGSSGTDGSSDSSDGVSASGASASATMTAGMTSSDSDPTASVTTNSTAPTTSMTTGDPDSASSTDPADTSTGDCPPGELDCPCDIGSTCSGELVCEDGTCVAEPSCDEPEGEPNDDEASAVELPGVTCGEDAMTVEGAFDGAESDWFRFEATSAIACFSDPRVEVTADSDIGVCLFIDCGDGDGTANCSGGPTEETSPEGLEGCCAQGDLTLEFDCGFGGFPPQTVTVLARLTSIEAACLPYELEFAY